MFSSSLVSVGCSSLILALVTNCSCNKLENLCEASLMSGSVLYCCVLEICAEMVSAALCCSSTFCESRARLCEIKLWPGCRVLEIWVEMGSSALCCLSALRAFLSQSFSILIAAEMFAAAELPKPLKPRFNGKQLSERRRHRS